MGCPNCRVGPGAFEGERAETAILEYYSLNGFSDDIVGDDRDKDVFIGPVEPSEDSVRHALEVGFCSTCIVVAAEALANCKSARFWIDDQGFRNSEVHR